MLSLIFAYLAGIVTILSPCVLPLLPIIIGSSANTHRHGPFYLAAGLVVSFTLFGFLIATVGLSIGLTVESLQKGAGVLMVLFGLLLFIGPLYQKFAASTSGALGGVNQRIMALPFNGRRGQFGLGAVLGAVWSPCVGPTLGAAIALAAQGDSLLYALSIMFIFAVGSATPVIIMALLSRQAMLKFKTALQHANAWLKPAMGGLLLAIGLLFATGGISQFEVFLLELTPSWLIGIVYRF